MKPLTQSLPTKVSLLGPTYRAFGSHATAGSPAPNYKKLLVIHKISRLIRFQRQGVLMRPYVDKAYREALTRTHNAHYGVINCFTDIAKRMGKEVVLVPEDELNTEDEEARKRMCDGVDFVVSMGGDHTFLKSQALLWDSEIPILGINTNRDVFEGVLNTHWIDFGKKEEQTSNLLYAMEDREALGFEKRSRILFER